MIIKEHVFIKKVYSYALKVRQIFIKHLLVCLMFGDVHTSPNYVNSHLEVK